MLKFEKIFGDTKLSLSFENRIHIFEVALRKAVQ